MTIDVEELILQPFREVVERGREAAGNAVGGSQADSQLAGQMLKSARGLIREGERALQRLQPVWGTQAEKHGNAFFEAVRGSDEIHEKRRVLEDLLYDMDDFTTVDTFDADRFAQVQSASKSFALTLLENLKRLRVAEPEPPRSSTPATTVSSLSAWPQHNVSKVPKIGIKAEVSEVDLNGLRLVRGSEREGMPHFSRKGAMQTTVHHTSSKGPRISEWVNEQTQSAKPWGPEQSPVAQFPYPPALDLDKIALQRMERVPMRPYSPVTAGSRSSAYTTTDSSYSGRRSPSTIPSSDTRTSSLAQSIAPPIPPTAALYDKKALPAVPPSPPESVTGSDRNIRGSGESSKLANKSATKIGMPRLIRVNTNCRIRPDSPFYQLGGFCEGAQKFQRGGYKTATKAITEYGSMGSVAKCVDCKFRCRLANVVMDGKGGSAANLSEAGVRYRVRFVYKSHLPTQMTHAAKYGCLFCIEQGYTTHEGDSTVFFKEEHLIQHLARHPQPLPNIPGVRVLYGDLTPDHPHKDDYDLHFPHPPAKDTYPSEAELFCMPSAVAVKSHERGYGEKPLEVPDGQEEALQFQSGSRIVGIEIPDEWKGKWYLGWQNGVKGVFPAKSVSVEAPKRLPGNEFSELSVKTRWKLDWRECGPDWLSFGAEETISNVTWVSESDWCWSGTTKKGKTGLFPKAFVHTDTVHHDGRPRTSGGAKAIGGTGFQNFQLFPKLRTTTSST